MQAQSQWLLNGERSSESPLVPGWYPSRSLLGSGGRGAVAPGVCMQGYYHKIKIYMANYCNLGNYYCIVVKLKSI